MFQFFIYFCFKKRRWFFCWFTLALIKKISGGGISFIFCGETMFDMFSKNKTRVAETFIGPGRNNNFVYNYLKNVPIFYLFLFQKTQLVLLLVHFATD